MNHKNLENFRHIFKSGDFNYISSNQRIREIEDIFSYQLADSDRARLKNSEVLLQKYLYSLHNFYGFVRKNFKADNNIKRGYQTICRILDICINFLREPHDIRRRTFKSARHKFQRNFRVGLAILWKRIDSQFGHKGKENLHSGRQENKRDFRPDERKNLIHHILDKNNGLGRRYLFNTIGDYSPTHIFRRMQVRDLKLVSRLLNKGRALIKGIKGHKLWRVLGYRRERIRILLYGNRVYFLFPVGEHDKYEKTLMKDPRNVAFSPA